MIREETSWVESLAKGGSTQTAGQAEIAKLRGPHSNFLPTTSHPAFELRSSSPAVQAAPDPFLLRDPWEGVSLPKVAVDDSGDAWAGYRGPGDERAASSCDPLGSIHARMSKSAGDPMAGGYGRVSSGGQAMRGAGPPGGGPSPPAGGAGDDPREDNRGGRGFDSSGGRREPPGGLPEALREDLEEAREGPGEDLVIRREVLGPLVVCQVVLGARIGSWTCWRLSARHRGSRLTTSGTGEMVIAKLVSRSAGIFPRSPLRVDQF